MPEIGRKIYYDKLTGNILVDTGERCGDVIETTTEQDFQCYAALAQRVSETVGVIQLAYGEMAEDFAQSEGFRVDLSTGGLLFSYPDPNNPAVSVERPSYEERISSLELLVLQLGGVI